MEPNSDVVKNEPITVLPPENLSVYNQIHGVPMSMALIGKDHRLLMSPVMCKDYIQDAFYSEHMKRSVSAYGLTWEPGRLALNESTYRLCIEFATEEAASKVENIVALLNEWDKRMGFRRTKLIPTNNKLQFVLEFSQAWTKQAFRISVFCTLARVASEFTSGEDVMAFLGEVAKGKRYTLTQVDQGYIQTGLNRLEKMWTLARFPKQTWKQFSTAYEVHGQSGLACYEQGKELEW